MESGSTPANLITLTTHRIVLIAQEERADKSVSGCRLGCTNQIPPHVLFELDVVLAADA